MEKDLTQLEILHLPETFNLTDGHAHRNPTIGEQAIVNNVLPMFTSVEREQQLELEKEYIAAFYGLTRQTVDSSQTRCLLLPSASMSLELVANYLRLAKLDLALIEPCFDNLANMFKRHDVALEAFPEAYLEATPSELARFLDTLHSKALCIVSPNNPTGVSYNPATFKQLVAFCKERGKLLILDTSFRVYKEPEHIFDEYALLQESGIDYIVIEDTGKTWPTKELKVSILAVSPKLYKAVYDIYTDFIYHHSPFTVKLLTEFVRNSAADKLEGVRGVVNANRQSLHTALQGSFLTPCEKPFASVAWLRIDNDLTAAQLANTLAQSGIFVLPGHQFFWSDETQSEYIRIALVREPERFARAMKRFRRVLQKLELADRHHAVSVGVEASPQ